MNSEASSLLYMIKVAYLLERINLRQIKMLPIIIIAILTFDSAKKRIENGNKSTACAAAK